MTVQKHIHLFLTYSNNHNNTDGNREADHFNASFLTTWKDTHNYKMWLSSHHSGILAVHPGHPFAGQLSVADMKLRLSQYVFVYCPKYLKTKFWST